MSYLENNRFDFFKDRRFVPVFFVTLLVVFGGVLLVGAVAPLSLECDLKTYFVDASPGLALLLGALVLKITRSRRAGRRGRYEPSPLSRDERSKARSKLVKQK